jgi:hypothetical protein
MCYLSFGISRSLWLRCVTALGFRDLSLGIYLGERGCENLLSCFNHRVKVGAFAMTGLGFLSGRTKSKSELSVLFVTRTCQSLDKFWARF